MSGGFATAVHLSDAVEAGRIDGHVCVVIGNNSRSVEDVAARTDEAFDVVGLADDHRERLRDLLTC